VDEFKAIMMVEVEEEAAAVVEAVAIVMIVTAAPVKRKHSLPAQKHSEKGYWRPPLHIRR
jgi:hypothetical protein